MKLGELFFEQVLIGLLLLMTIALPFGSEIAVQKKLEDVDVVLGLAGGALIISIAFLIGLVFDRVADSLTDRIETHNRLRFAIERGDDSKKDPYPEDEYRLTCLTLERDLVVFINYHRSRIRVSRAMMVYGPAVTVSAVVAAARFACPDCVAANWRWMVLAAFVYIIGGLAASLLAKLPKTHQRAALHEYRDRYQLTSHGQQTLTTSLAATIRGLLPLLAEPLVWCEVALLVFAFVLALTTGQEVVITIAGALGFLTILSAWTWWRVSFTYRGYLMKAAESRSASHP